MSWSRSSRVRTGLAALAVAALAGAARAETLVVRSAGPSARSFPPGTALKDSVRIVLQPNDQVVLLDGRGTRTLKGPGSFSPLMATSSSFDARSTFASLVAQRSDRRARVGAVRGPTGSGPAAPSIWSVDIAKSSNVCITDPASVTLWDSAAAAPQAVTVSGDGGRSETVALAPNAAWPAALPITGGASYAISWPGAAQPTTVRFVKVERTLTGLEDLAKTLIAHGCDAQLDLLIATVAVPGPATPSGG